jgi:membrane-bound inhibitor of C-type lysozyme
MTALEHRADKWEPVFRANDAIRATPERELGMRLFGPAGLSIALLAGCAHNGESIYDAPRPRDIPYSCGDGHMARIAYQNGGWFVRARASLVWDGRTIALQASPPTYGLRYVSADDNADPILVWTARGEEAWIAELARNAPQDAPEHEVARCTRVREGGPEPVTAEGAAH